MKKTLLFISVLAGMAMTFTGCDANVNINVPQSAGSSSGQAADNTAVSGITANLDDEETPAVTEVSTVTNAAVTEEAVTETAVSEVTAVTESTAVAAVSEAAESSRNENFSSYKKNETVYSIASNLAAPGSPFEKGYIEAGYGEMLSRYYDVEFNGPTYFQYSLNCGTVNLGTAWNLKKSEGKVHSLAGNIKVEDTEYAYRRLFEYIDSKVGEGSYRIHDAYTESSTEVFGPVDDEVVTSNAAHVDIVLNSDLDKYTKASDADKSKYVIRFEADFSGGIRSEYEYHSRREETVKNIISDLNRLAPDYVYGVDECFFYDYGDVLTTVHGPFFSAEKNVLINGHDEDEYWLTRRRNVTAVEDGKDVSESELRTNLSLTVYCRPGTDESSFRSVLETIYPVTSEYGVGYINFDVLENDSDYDRYEMCEGNIPEETVRTTGRYRFCNLPENNWMVPGK